MSALIEARWTEVEAWLDVLLELPPGRHEPWLETRCADPALRREVLALLERDALGWAELDRLAASIGPAAAPRVRS